mmetsp:Transcript_5328/g.5803  ORF Transcript_5328/g.5803 Transcript_5328/m.5803 type:complete len:542 (+) Transcript_5328:23-1648(+)
MRIINLTLLIVFFVYISAKRPNVLYLHVDSMDGRTALPGSPALTPNIDALIKRGVQFTNTYAHAPECVPSRSSLWSGRRTDRTGAYNNGRGLSVQYPIAMDRVYANGYDIGILGRRDFNFFGDSFNPAHSMFANIPSMMSEEDILTHSLSANLSAWLRAVPDLNLPWEWTVKPTVLPNSANKTDVHTIDWKRAEQCSQFLQDRAKNGSDTPFFVSCGFICPHPVYKTSQYWYEKGVDASKITLPVWGPLEEMHPVQRYESDTKDVALWPNMTVHNWDPKVIKEIRHVYYAMIAEADAFVGQVLNALKSSGLEDDTIVIFWSDHGDMTMEHRQFYKESLLEGSARVPLVIAGPGVKKGKKVTRATSLLDLFPTVMDLTQTPWPTGNYSLDGYSLLEDISDGTWETLGPHQKHPDWIFFQWHGDHTNTGQFGIRQGDWKYIRYIGYTSHLFNITADPGELDDLATKNPDVVKKLDALLMSVVDPVAVDKAAKDWDKEMFKKWKEVQGDQWLESLASNDLRWHPGWETNPKKWTDLINTWLATP